jgi:hypothetical protein
VSIPPPNARKGFKVRQDPLPLRAWFDWLFARDPVEAEEFLLSTATPQRPAPLTRRAVSLRHRAEVNRQISEMILA